MSSVYLDWNATPEPLAQATEAMQDAMTNAWGNPSSPHSVGQTARRAVENARDGVAKLMQCSSHDVVFTSGATEANNLAVRGLCEKARLLVTSRIEHPSIVRVAEHLESAGLHVHWSRIDSSGTIVVDDVNDALNSSPNASAVVAVQAANHETGIIQPVFDIVSVAGKHGAIVHVDASQAAGKLSPSEWVGAVSVSVSSHKLRGPKGIGALVLAACGTQISPLIRGGRQEKGLRAGTVSAPLAVGFGAAARWAVEHPYDGARVAALRDRLEQAMLMLGAQVNGSHAARRLPHVCNVSFAGDRGDEIVLALDHEGVCASVGSACSSGLAAWSAVIETMLGRERAISAVRFSLGESTTEPEILDAIERIARVLRRRRPTIR